MTGICTCSYPSPYLIEKVENPPYLYSYSYPINVEIPVKTRTSFDGFFVIRGPL